LENYVDVFTWYKRELGCCVVGEYIIDTQGLPPCHTIPNSLSFYEEAKVSKQIQTLVKFLKMRSNSFKYIYKLISLMKKVAIGGFAGNIIH
jgi:hypothetical protein